jgi:hypothetical protein
MSQQVMKKRGRPCKYDVRSSITFVTTPEAKQAFEETCFHERKTMSDILHGLILQYTRRKAEETGAQVDNDNASGYNFYCDGKLTARRVRDKVLEIPQEKRVEVLHDICVCAALCQKLLTLNEKRELNNRRNRSVGF